jgi:hypothetical protein
MKSEIAAIRASAPTPITIALEPLRPEPPDEELVAVETVGGAVVVVETVAWFWGMPGVNGLVAGF